MKLTVEQAVARVSELNEIYQQIKQQAKDNFASQSWELFESIFEKHPKLKAFAWTQYAPYFNDGDACEFSVHTDEPYMLFEGVDEFKRFQIWDKIADGQIDNGQGRMVTNYRQKTDEEMQTEMEKDGRTIDYKTLNEAETDIKTLINAIPEYILEEIYGDGKVVVSRDGKVDTEDYDHD